MGEAKTLNRARTAVIAGAAGVVCLGAFWGVGSWQKAATYERNCAAITSELAERGPFEQVPGGGESVAIIGDSYTAGQGAPDKSSGWSHVLAESEGWNARVDGIGFTGFVNGGFCEDAPFASRVDEALSVNPDLLIIQGGLNDYHDQGDVAEAAKGLLASVASVPEVVIVGPPVTPERGELDEVEQALQDAAESAGRQYVSASAWNLEYGSDGLHLTEAGHREFAANVAAAID